MTLTLLMTAYNMFCDNVNVEMIREMQTNTSTLTVYEVAILGLYLKALKTGNSPTTIDFINTLSGINKNE